MTQEESKKGVSWYCPTPIVNAFREEVLRRRENQKKIGLQATAAMLMYLAADEETKDYFDDLADRTERPARVVEVLEVVSGGRAERRPAAKNPPQSKGKKTGSGRGKRS